MIGLGTIVNVGAILLGGIVGLLFGKFISPRFQDILMKTNGVCVIFIGISGCLKEMMTVNPAGVISTQGTMMLIACMALGSLLGEAINVEHQVERFGTWLKNKTGSKKDNLFVDGFLTATLTVCIGAMTIVGSLEDGLNGNYDILFAKSILDGILLVILSASMGKGCMFSAIPVAVIQGGITALATLLKDLMTPLALSNLSLVGSVLIFCVGVNLVRKDTVKVANMVPAIFLAIAWAFIFP